jgi:hypothetical protein
VLIAIKETRYEPACWLRNNCMGSAILRSESKGAAPTSSVEVEFALVLNRMIDSVRNDPEHLRATVYELARVKLKEQFGADADIGQLTKSLEVAIHGVERFSIENGPSPLALSPPSAETTARLARPAAEVASELNSRFGRRQAQFIVPWRFAVVVVIGIAILFALKLRFVSVDAVRNEMSRLAGSRAPVSPKSAQVAVPQVKPATSAQPPADPLTPTSYGIYAVSDNKLHELEMLPGRAPDLRVAISAAIQSPSKTTLSDGHIKFIVFRRDSATSAADRADVRIVARIARETNFDQAGKAVISKVDDTWVMRNISIPFRTAPKADNPDMYEVQSENAETALAPGRYALVLKGQAYDFSVAGSITDPKQCLERLAATNGQFYSECQKP